MTIAKLFALNANAIIVIFAASIHGCAFDLLIWLIGCFD